MVSVPVTLVVSANFCYNILMTRQKAIIWTSIIGIITNVVLVGFKMAVGLIAGSIAIILDAVNNLTDVLSSVVTIVGTKLAHRRPDEGHPYGHGRLEYLSALIVGAIILATGIMALLEAIPKIIHPELADYSWATIVVVVSAIFAKLILGLYVKKTGRKLDSSCLVASGADALFDAALSFSTLVGIIVTLVFQISIDGILGAGIAVFIIYSSLRIIFEASSDILGHSADYSLVMAIKEEICIFPEVSGAYDFVIHNYGPSDYIGSVQIQVPDNMTAKDLHKLTREIAQRIFTKFGVTLTVGIYAENSGEPAHQEIKGQILNVLNLYPEIRQMHGLYIDDDEQLITFDLVMGADPAQQIEVRDRVIRDLSKHYPDYQFLITFDVDFGIC